MNFYLKIFISNNTNLNVNLSNIIFHYNKELPYKTELLEKTINILENCTNHHYHNTWFENIYNIKNKWYISLGSKKYIDYKFNRKYENRHYKHYWTNC
jgi:hypothetical protein